MTELWALGAVSTAQKIRQQEVTAVDVTEAALQRMDSVNPILNAVVDDCRDSALATANDIDKRIKAGETLGPMAGVPVTVKVNLDQKGHATTNGLQLQKDLIAPSNSPVVDNLTAAGAIIIGRTNTPAFSMRWFTRNSLHGHTLNPVNQALTPGGSSGGAASAAAAGIGALAHGTDIAGSIRYPAYACGIHGLRPTLGRVPIHNETAPDRLLAGQLMAVSGPLARSINDLALGFAVMSGGFEQANTLASARDPWWVPAPLELPTPAKRAALCLNPDNLEVDPELIKAMQVAAQKLTDDGWEVVETDCPPLAEAANLNLLLWMLEMEPVAAIVQQEGDADAIFVYQQLLENRRDVEKLSAAEIMQRRSALTREWQLFLHQYPVLICPPCGELPFADLLDVESPSSFARVLEAQMPQVGLPLMGIPGLCVTTGFSGNGPTRIPVGVQLVAGRFREDLLLRTGKLLEATILPATPEGVA